ncbi:MAG: hypothetical protein ABIZ95_10230, partial [Pyrinomonadaceae bacterium]
MKLNSLSNRRRSLLAAILSSLALGLTILLVISIRSPQPAEAAASQFDQLFGTRGFVSTDVTPGDDDLTSVAIQSDGKIVAAGSCGIGTKSFCVVRYNVNGTVNGTVTTSITGTVDKANAIALQADGKIVVGGVSSFEEDFTVVRYNANLTLDTSFDGDGIAVIPLSDSQVINDLAIQPDGKILAAGWTSGTPGRHFMLARFNPNGSMDTSFDTDGLVVTLIGSAGQATSVALQSDGKIVAAGFATVSGGNHFAAARYNANGSLDTTFDADGSVTTAIGAIDQSYDLLVQPDGKIVVAGYTTTEGLLEATFALVRYNQNGSLDATFDGDGKLITNFGHTGRGLAMQADGKIVAVGTFSYGNPLTAVVRINPNGSLDDSFHGDGRFLLLTPGSTQDTTAVAIQADGMIVIGGWNDHQFILHRLLGDPHQAFTNFNAMFPADRVGTNPPGLPSNYGSLGDISGLRGTVTKVR